MPLRKILDQFGQHNAEKFWSECFPTRPSLLGKSPAQGVARQGCSQFTTTHVWENYDSESLGRVFLQNLDSFAKGAWRCRETPQLWLPPCRRIKLKLGLVALNTSSHKPSVTKRSIRPNATKGELTHSNAASLTMRRGYQAAITPSMCTATHCNTLQHTPSMCKRARWLVHC